MKKPIILCARALVDKRLVVNEAYAKAIENSGGILLMLASEVEDFELDDVLQNVDGLLLTGGTDVNPSLYEEEKKEYTGDSDNYRDIVESMLIEKAIEKKMPILGICRGMQMLNVKLGGSLYQDILKEMPGSLQHDRHHDGPRSMPAHKVTVKENSLMHSVLGTTEIEVNSLHHQGIKTLSPELKATCVTPDGLVEGAEMSDYPFLLCMQWHPEELLETPVWKNIFDAFINACKK
ncbi:MAG: gamma-glutamyl-gamma-aminobutyrate hydrolase family protein [Patescibacteria group bacterium]